MDHCYLACTLPMLRFGELPKQTAEEFSADWAEKLPEKDRAAVRQAELFPGKLPNRGALREFWLFETALRNAVSRLRRSGADAGRDLRPAEKLFVWLESAVHEASAIANPLEKERRLDKLRWDYLDELESRSLFGTDFFVIYKLKLAILDKYRTRQAEAGERSFRFAVNSILQAAESKS